MGEVKDKAKTISVSVNLTDEELETFDRIKDAMSETAGFPVTRANVLQSLVTKKLKSLNNNEDKVG